MRATDAVVLSALLAGAGFTWSGWRSAGATAWRTSEHTHWFLGMWAVASLLVVWRRMSSLAAAALMFGTIALATGHATALAAVLTMAWSAVVVGRGILRRWPGAHWHECAAVGLAVSGATMAALVHVPIHYAWVHLALLAAPLVLDRREALATAAVAWRSIRERNPADFLHRVVGSAAIAAGGLHLVVGLMPEIGYDALVTHLLVPMRIAQDHVWQFDVDRNVWTVMPLLGDWLYTIGCVLAGETGARLVNVACIALLAALIHDLACWIGADRRGAATAVLLYLVTPLTLTESSSLFIESVWSCCLVGGIAAVLRAASTVDRGATHGPRHLATAGILLGGAMAAKAVTMTALPVLAGVLGLGWRRWMRRDCAGALVVGALGFLAIGGFHYARAWFLTGNPVFPFYNAVFRSPHYPPENFAPPPQFEVGSSWDTLYRITFDAGHYLEARPGAAGFHWLLLVVPVGIAFVATRHRRGAAVLAIAFAIAWLTFRQTAYLRYVFPSFAMIAAGIGAVLGGTPRLGGVCRAGLGVAALVASALGVHCIASGGYYAAIVPEVLFGGSARDEYVARRRPLRAAVEVVNGLSTNDAPVAFFGQPFGAGLRVDGLWTNWYNHRFSSAALGARTPDDIARLMVENGARLLLLTADWRDEERRALVRAASDEVAAVGTVSVRRVREEFLFRDELVQVESFTSTTSERVPTAAGHEYRIEVLVRAAAPAPGATAQLQVQWLAADARLLATSTQDVACNEESRLHRMDVVAPAGSVAAVIVAGSRAGAEVHFESLTFLH